MTSDSQAAIAELHNVMKQARIIIQSLQGKTDNKDLEYALFLLGVLEKMVKDALK